MKLHELLISIISVVILCNDYTTISQDSDESPDINSAPAPASAKTHGETKPLNYITSYYRRKNKGPNFKPTFNYTDSWYLKNYIKYFESLKIYSNKVNGTHNDPKPRLKIPDYHESVSTSCTDPELWTTIIGNFTTIGESQEKYMARLKTEKRAELRDKTCLFHDSIPILRCNNASKTCECLDIPRSPYGFFSGKHPTKSNRSICYAMSGAICDSAKLPCEAGSKCTDGICGLGSLSLLQRFNEGRQIRFTDVDLEQIAAKDSSLEEIIADLMRHDTGTKEIPMGKDCSMDIWAVTLAEKYVELLTILGTEDDPTEVFDQIEFESPGLQDIPSSFSENAETNLEELIDTIPCLDQFPSMTCEVDPILEFSRCVCTDLPPPFRYVYENNRCVGLMGSICTTVHGDIECSEDIKCEPLALRDRKGKIYKELPTVLSSLEIKICGGIGALGLRSGSDEKLSKRKSNDAVKNLSPISNFIQVAFMFIMYAN